MNDPENYEDAPEDVVVHYCHSAFAPRGVRLVSESDAYALMDCTAIDCEWFLWSARP